MPERYGRPSTDIIRDLQFEIVELKRRLVRLESGFTTTVPIYAKNQLSARDLVPGQIFIGKDNTLNYVQGTVDQTTVYELNGIIYAP
jgi:hypothetical protein